LSCGNSRSPDAEPRRVPPPLLEPVYKLLAVRPGMTVPQAGHR
jgi:hypothetical protein